MALFEILARRGDDDGDEQIPRWRRSMAGSKTQRS